MKRKNLWFGLIFFFSFLGQAEEIRGINFEELKAQELAKLCQKGTMLIVQRHPDGSLKEVSAGALVNAGLEQVWGVITDYPHYSEFMPQTTRAKIIRRESENLMVIEQEIEIKIWMLKVNLCYQLEQTHTPRQKIRFRHYRGDLPGTYGGWDLLPVPGRNQTLIFYSLYSNLTALPWPLGSIMKSQSDFFTAVNVSTATLVVNAVKEEAEKRASSGSPAPE